LLGRNLLFEFVRNHLPRLDRLEIIILGRADRGKPLSQRILEIMLRDGVHYLLPAMRELSCKAGTFALAEKPTEQELNELAAYCTHHIRCIALDLDAEKMHIDADDLAFLRRSPIDYFFHVAALTDFGSSAAVEQRVQRTNVRGTGHVLDL